MEEAENQRANEAVSDKILTGPNVITLLRLLLVPVFLYLLFALREDIWALVVYALASGTDWIDGQLARRTHQVSKFGKLFDPAVDRILLATGVISVCLLGRLPLWIVILLVARDACLLIEGRILLGTVGKVPAVIYVGKFATAFLMVGYCLLLLGIPMVSGLGIFETEISWLPGFAGADAYLGIYFVYIGIVLSIIAFTVYHVRGIRMFSAYRASLKQTTAK